MKRLRNSVCGAAVLAAAVVLLVAAPGHSNEPKAGQAGPGDDEKARLEKAVESAVKAAEEKRAERSADKQYEFMKDMAVAQKEMFQSHLNTVALILAVVGVVLTFLQWRAERSDNKRDARTTDEQQKRDERMATEQQRLLQEQDARDKERLAREQGYDAKLKAYMDQAIAYTQNTSNLTEEMTKMLAANEASRRLVNDAEAKIAEELKRRDEAAEGANKRAADFLDRFGLNDDGFADELANLSRSLDVYRARASDDKLRPQVAVVEGLVQWVHDGSTDRAVQTWQERVLRSDQPTEPRLRARTNFYVGLALTQKGDYARAQTALRDAENASPADLSYHLAGLQVRIFNHRRGNLLSDAEAEAVRDQLEQLWDRFHSEGAAADLGRMSHAYFRGWLAYTYAAFLAHELGHQPGRLAEAEAVVADVLKKPQQRTAELDGIRCAIALKKNAISVTELDDFIRQCNIDLIAADNSLEEFSHSLRLARLIGRRGAAKRKLGAPGTAADDHEMTGMVNQLQKKLARMKRSHPQASVYSPVTRMHEPLALVEAQLNDRYAPDKFDAELASVSVTP